MFGIAFIVILLLVTRLYQASRHPAVTSTTLYQATCHPAVTSTTLYHANRHHAVTSTQVTVPKDA